MTKSMQKLVFEMDEYMIKQHLKLFKCINMNKRRQISVQRYVQACKAS